MTGLEEARGQILQMVGTVARETVPLKDAAGRIAADSVTANHDLPLFDNSAMDGYAVRSVDVSRATMVKPVKLKIIGKIAAGDVWDKRIEEETAIRLFTGSAMPGGANAVVMQEDTIEGGPDEIQILEPVKPYENVRLKGEDVRKGEVVVTSGGVSVGEFDYVKQAFEAIGGKQNLWKVNIKPGKPFVFGRKGDKFLFGLPGNPVSALVTFVLLVRPALLRMQGATNVDLPSHSATLMEQLSNRGDRRHFMRVCVESSGKVRLSGTQASHMLSSLAAANGLVDVPPGKTLEAGATVQVWRLDL